MARRLRFPWMWWWELPGLHWWFPERFLGRDVAWSVNAGGPVAWPGRVRCLFLPHADDSYGNCCYCGRTRRPEDLRWE